MDDINSVSNLEQNFAKLREEMINLGPLKERVKRRNELYPGDMVEWLHIAEEREREVEEIESKLNKLTISSFPPNYNDRYQLNKKVIVNLKAVNILKGLATATPESIHAFFIEIEIGQPKAFSRVDIMFITSHFSESNLIRSNLFGNLYKGKFPNGKQVSVKVLEDKDVSQGMFMSEVRSLSKASHRNLLKLYGYCFEHNCIALIYEYMENGSLGKILYQNPLNLEWDTFYGIAIKTAKAVAYLHDGCDDQIIHYNIIADNVLLDEKLSPKVAEFGLAKLIKEGKSHITNSSPRGTPGYIAPEMWIPSSRITCSCDIYSFGLMLFEILGMRENFKKGQVWFPQHVWSKFNSDQLDDLFKECGTSEKDTPKAKTLVAVALWCIQYSAKVRPSMSTVVKMLEMEFPVPNPRTTNPFKTI